MSEVLVKNEFKPWSVSVTLVDRIVGKKFYVTADIRYHSTWWGDEIFNGGLEKLEFFLPMKHVITLAGMEQYNFFVEATQGLGGGNPKIEAFWFLGKIPGTKIVESWRISNGKIVRDRKIFGKEWGGTPTRGWKMGLVGPAPISQIMRVS